MADVKKIATRDSYGNTLKELAAEGHDDLVVLDADLAAATKTGMFQKAYPDRHFDCGIAEGNMMGVAAGLSTISSHFSGRFRKILCHGSDSGTNLQYKIILRDTRRLNDLFQNMLVDQKILTKPFLENKMILLKDFNGIFRVTKIRSGHIFYLCFFLFSAEILFKKYGESITVHTLLGAFE